MRTAQIGDLDTAREVARLLEQEVERLTARLAELVKEVAKLRGQEGTRQLEIELMKLREQNALLQHRLFGRSSEKRAGTDGDSNEDGAGDKKEKKPGHGPRPQPALPEMTEEHALDDVPVACKVCGEAVHEWPEQFEESEEITVEARRFVLVRHQRQKGRCGCYATIVTAPAPPKLIAGGRYSIEFAVDVAVSKYLDHLPLNRQAGIMEREGLVVESQTLWDQIEALAGHLDPTYQALRAYIRAKPLLHADETPWYLLDEKPAKRWYVWCVTVDDAAYYWIRDGRGAAAGREVLGGYRGIVVADGYKAYETLARGNKALTLAYCWSHVRRKILEAEKFYPDQCRPALDLIRDLYAVEREVPTLRQVDSKTREDVLRLRTRLRNERSRSIAAAIKDWAESQHALPESALRVAINYMVGLWPGLILFLDNPLIPLDNNSVERSLRGPVVGRKNHYGSRSRRGTEVAALFYSILGTAKLVGVEPKAYLLHAARTAIRRPGTSVFPHELIQPTSPPESEAAVNAANVRAPAPK